MAHPDTNGSTAPDDKLDGLVRAIAAELIQLGYRPAKQPGHVVADTLGARTINPAIWQAMREILAGREP